ncbi:Retrotransposon-derived protein PEG10 [Rhizoctonia solani]|uniref:Retrotransposon-derived protein PEG10 n=1 Tax=Rhizoctonia solani TaxID=456999 RepID=A0A8H8SU10_9AGAM|nr:Retrotransposon-derived protein PEG10 [Rhizoctonia solani]QRW16618.1 Retrotransposon-derived protein PEG10 [Rhizoctonia solani]
MGYDMEEKLLEVILEVDRKIGLPKEPEPERTETERNSEEEDGDSLHLSRQRQSSSARRTSITKEARLKQPNVFNGKRGTEAKTFIMKMEMYIKEYPGNFTDERKIRATLTNMGEGEPVKWASPLMQKHLTDEPHEYLTCWNAFKAAFLLNFSDPSKRDRVIREINSLKQTGSAQKDLDWDEKALIDTFKKGLKINLQSELICMKITTPEIDNYSLEQIIEVAIRTDDILQQAASIRDTTTPPSVLKKGKTNNYRPTERFPSETSLKRSQAELFKQLPQHRSFDCSINFKEGSELPKPAKAYPMSPAESKAMKKYMEKELLDGKTDGRLRLVVDCGKINDITSTDQFPMPLQSDLLEKVKDANIFSKLDLKSGYNNIRIKAGEEWKTAFRTKDGLFQEEHTKHLREVLRRIRDNNLYLKLAKCLFHTTEVTYIGIVITPEGISMEKEKIKAVQEWKEPNVIE